MSTSRDVPQNLYQNFEVVLGAARRDRQRSLGVLLDVYRGFLMTSASRNLPRDMAAKVAPSDLVQETLMQAARSFDQFNGSSEPELRVWLKRILARKMIDTHRYFHEYAVRDIGREVRFLNDTAANEQRIANNQDSCLDRSDQMQILAELFEHLKEDERRAIQLRTFERLSFEDVGKSLGRSMEAARKIWTRAIQKMSKEFRNRASRP